MKATYDPRSDVLGIELARPRAESEDDKAGVILDCDAADNRMGSKIPTYRSAFPTLPASTCGSSAPVMADRRAPPGPAEPEGGERSDGVGAAMP